MAYLAIELLQVAAQVAAGEPFGLVHHGHLVGVLVNHLQVALQPRAAVLGALQAAVKPVDAGPDSERWVWQLSLTILLHRFQTALI